MAPILPKLFAEERERDPISLKPCLSCCRRGRVVMLAAVGLVERGVSYCIWIALGVVIEGKEGTYRCHEESECSA